MTAFLIALFGALVIAGLRAESVDVDGWRGDCPWCDGRGDWSCKHCVGGYLPWCQLPEEPGETVTAKCMGDGTNSMGDKCPNCRNRI